VVTLPFSPAQQAAIIGFAVGVGALVVALRALVLALGFGVAVLLHAATLPTTHTAYSSGVVNMMGPSGVGFGSYTGATTVLGSETILMPYLVDKYDQAAFYFVPLQRKGAPALMANLVPGDVVAPFDHQPPYDLATMHQAVDAAEGRTVDVEIVRGGSRITKQVSVVW